MPIVNIFELAEKEKADIENLSVDQLKAEMADNKDLLLIDIREIQETIDLGTIPGAIHCARGMLEFWASPASPYYRDYFQEDRRTVVFCAGGGRSVLQPKHCGKWDLLMSPTWSLASEAGRKLKSPSKMSHRPVDG